MTELVFDPLALAWLIAGLILGLIIGRLAWGGGRRRVVPVADTAALTAAASSARADADARGRELVAAQAAMRPLTDEVDRLKRELARARAATPVAAPAPVAVPPVAAPAPIVMTAGTTTAAAAPPHVAPTPPLAGAGPFVVGETVGMTGRSDADAVPDIRQLKGVGDKFAAALNGLGLGSVDRLARLTPDEASDADSRLGSFNGRIARDRLVEQCVLLDEGRVTEYETRFGKLGGPVLI